MKSLIRQRRLIFGEARASFLKGNLWSVNFRLFADNPAEYGEVKLRDKTILKVTSGAGGSGKMAYDVRRGKAKGKPQGGDGGRGGNIYIKASRSCRSLPILPSISAGDGAVGGASGRTGKAGSDRYVDVPLGTVVRKIKMNQDRQILQRDDLADLADDGDEILVCEGGAGGLGNQQLGIKFRAEEGKPGLNKLLELELKILADVGLVGYPNAGKSTFINTITRTKSKIAPYAFTTLQPHVGAIQFVDGKQITVADIPGLIEGAHEDRGLGHEFLRHIERTSVLVYVVDCSGKGEMVPWTVLRKLQNEVEMYNPEMVKKPSIVLANKSDVQYLRVNEKFRKLQKAFPDLQIFKISALNSDGYEPVVRALRQLVYPTNS